MCYITALMLACLNGHKAVSELLIQKGADVNYQDKVSLRYVRMYYSVCYD